MTSAQSTRGGEPRLIIPALGPIYDAAAPYRFPLLRVVAGLMLLTHGWPKVMMGAQAVAANVLARRGIEPALFFAYVIMFLETIGGIMIAIGLLTRPIALLLVIEFIVIVKFHAANGWSAGAGGAEFPFLWLVCFVVILLRGGGPLSVDRWLGREF
jgi:putative oxidoreductase